MYGKLEITARIRVLTGLHIGGSKEFSNIGAVDSPVMRDAYSGKPYIPGSSIKGKLRYLLQQELGEKAKINSNFNDDDIRVLRLFGSSNDSKNEPGMKSRLYFSDCYISNEEELKSKGLDELTEVKFENGINRFTAVATPRQIERVIRGTEFDFNLIYNIDREDEILEDIENLKKAMVLLKYDYLGGNGSRGYGRVEFRDLDVKVVNGEVDSIPIGEIKEILVSK